MRQYLDLLERILTEGVDRGDRTGVGTRALFGPQMEFDLSRGFPLVTTKKLHLRSIIHELLWFLAGDTNTAYLANRGVSIWDEWADEKGDLGPIYGAQWCRWPRYDAKGEINQIETLVHDLISNPNSRRHVVSAWNVAQLDAMALAPCHALFQCFVANGRLSMKLYQRSADFFLGVPFNIASYSLLTHMLAQQCDLQPGSFIWSGGDVHLYHNHFEQAREQLKRQPRDLPHLQLRQRPPDIFSYEIGDFLIEGYDPWPPIAAPIAV